MAVPEGHFVLRPRVGPDLDAAEWRIRADHELRDDDGSVGSVQRSNVHFTVNSPRYVLPPGQVLSTYPPANSIGSYGSRLPQVVLKRRTLPWERRVDDDRPLTPFMALVLIAEGEAEFRGGETAAACFTEGVDLPLGDTLDDPEVSTGNCLVIRKSMVDRIFPTQEEVDLLAHSREVDINDTELAMGDDDGFLSVVVANRLPVPGVDDDGNEVPVTYLACLVNLEGQLGKLLPEAPEPVSVTSLVHVAAAQLVNPTLSDHAVMKTADASPGVQEALGGALAAADIDGPQAEALGGSVARHVDVTAGARNANQGFTGGSAWVRPGLEASAAQIYVDMAAGFAIATAEEAPGALLDEELRFPVMLHWSFTTDGQTTFKSLMQELDSRLIGDTSEAPTTPDGRPPLEVTETGHTGLVHRTRDGDTVRSWYRGPITPHPMDNRAAARLPLAHSSDQLRVVTPDGREDLSLAGAFEVGRLLALSQPAVIAALLRWRQDHFRAARLGAIRESTLGTFVELGILDEVRAADVLRDDVWGLLLGRRLVHDLVVDPDGFLGAPRPIVTPGRPLDVDGVPTEVLAVGLGLDQAALRGQPAVVFERLRAVDTPLVELDLGKLDAGEILGGLQVPIDDTIRDLSTDVLAEGLVFDAATGAAFGAIGLPELGEIDVTDHFTSVLGGSFTIDTIGDIGGIGGIGGVNPTLGRPGRGGLPLAEPAPTSDDDQEEGD